MTNSVETVPAEQIHHLSQATFGPVVIKLGGSVLDEALGMLDDVAALWRAGYPVTLVHGGGPAINRWLAQMGVTPRFINGRRVTDAATLTVVRAVMAGEINTEIVRQLGLRGVRAVGLSGLDAAMIQARRAEPDLGLVGLHPHADPLALRAILAAGALPVVTPLGLGPAGECLNINADDVATAIAIALHAAELIFLSDVPGVCDTTGTVIPTLTPASVRELLATGIITSGMIPKIEGCLAALAAVRRVHIIAGNAPGTLLATLTNGHHPGTLLVQ